MPAVKKAAQATPNRQLRQERERRCWSQLEVADRIGTTSFNVSRWERGITFPTAHFRQALCALFSKSAWELGLLQDETADHERVSQPGDIFPQQEVVSSKPRPEAERPWNVPFLRNPFFTGRGQLLERLHEHLYNARRAALNQPHALTGLGGIGKTQTAIEYAYRYRDEYTAVLWVRADSRETLVADFVALARLLSLPGQEAQNQTLIVEAVKRWLAQNEGWLLILDNADELPLLKDFLPGEGKGHMLLTTRAHATGKIAESLVVEKLELSEGMQLLLRRAKLLDSDGPLDNASRTVRAQAQSLAEELDGLPLALDQAGAYIEETGCRVAEYLKLYQRSRSALLKRQSSVSADYPHTVGSTWSLSVRKVEQESLAAADLLRLCAYLAPDAIPEEIITEGAAELGPVLSPIAGDPLLLNEAIQVLRRYSLVRRDPEMKLLNVHRLVQVVLKDSLDRQTQRLWAERVVRAVNAAFPEITFATWSRCEGCLPHAHACAALIDEYHFIFPEAARLLDQAGWYLRERGLGEKAEPLLYQALAIREQKLGPTHPDVAQSLHHLAVVFYLHGKYVRAEPLYQRALTIREQALGPEHPDTAYTLNHLAWLYQTQGKYGQAEPLYRRALTIQEQALGPTHPIVAESLSSLGVLYYYQGKYEQAESLHQRALAIQEQALGSNHPDVAESLDYLADLYREQGKYEQAEPLYQRALTIEKQALGPDHPITSTTLACLGTLYQIQGRYEQAEPLYQHALAIREQALGPNHHLTAAILDNLATLYQAQNKHEQAELLYQRALTILEQAIGTEHPRTAAALDHLATLYQAQNKYGQAEMLYQRSLAIREQKLGQIHPDVAQSLHHLAGLYNEQSKYKQAVPLFQRALTIREEVPGLSHPDTIKLREDYTELLHTMQKLQTVTPQQEAR